MRPWLLLLLLALAFALVGAGLGLGGLLGGQPVLALVGLPFLLLGVLLGVLTPRVRRQHVHDLDALRPVAPGEAPATTGRWSFEQVGAELARVLASSPHVVEATPGLLRVRADLADARFLTVAGASRLVEVRTLDVVDTGQGRAALRDGSRSARWDTAVGAGGLRLAGSASMFSGRLWSREVRIELGADRDGVGASVEYAFSSAELRRPAEEVLHRAGWAIARPAEVSVAIVVAAIGASAVVIVPVALLLTWLAR